MRVAFGLVFLAELGDKSMLLALAFAARFKPWPVFAGICVAAVVATGIAAAVGGALGAALPAQALAIGGGLLFIAFGAWMLRQDDDAIEADVRSRSVFAGVTLAFLVAEIGDKTTLATAALASTQDPVATWIGASLGMSAASGLAIVVGNLAGSRLPQRVIRLAAAAAFVIFGALLLSDGFQAS